MAIRFQTGINVEHGVISGDGSGLTNLNAGELVGEVSAELFPFVAIQKISFLLALDSPLTVGTNQTRIGSISSSVGSCWKWQCKAKTNGASGGFSFDIKKNGVSIFSAPQSIAANVTTLQTGNTFSVANVAEGDEFTVDITSVGTGVQDVVINLLYLTGNTSGIVVNSLTLDGLTDVTITSPTDGQSLVYSGGTWINGAGSGGGGGAPTDATYITKTTNGTLTNEFALASLSTGLLKVTTTTGDLTTAVAGTDYAAASHVHTIADVTNLQTALDAKAPVAATYITKTADANLTGEFALSLLSTGLLKVTTTTGDLTTAVAGTDYAAASHSHDAVAIATGIISTARLGSGTANSTTYLRGDGTWSTPSGVGGSEANIVGASGSPNTTLTTTEAQIGSVTITPSSTSAKIAISARLDCTKDGSTTVRVVTARVRRGTANSDTQVGLDQVLRSLNVATTPFGPSVILAVDSPNTTSPVTYSIRALTDAGSPVANRFELVAHEAAPKGADGAGGGGTSDHGELTGLSDDDHLQYHTNARALTWLGTRSTTDIPEGTNLYYTNVRADARISTALGVTVAPLASPVFTGTPTSTTPTTSDNSTRIATTAYVKSQTYVTSVAMTVPTGFSIAGSPITTSGTLALTTTLSGMIKGTGSGFAVAVAGTDYAAASHTHAASDIASGVISTARLGTGTANNTTYLRGDGTWATPSGGGGGASAINDLSDVTVTTPADGDLLIYNGTAWINQSPSTFEAGTNITLDFDSGTNTTTISASGGSGTPAGSNTHIQFNNSGSFGADAALRFDNSANILYLGDSSTNVELNLSTSTEVNPTIRWNNVGSDHGLVLVVGTTEIARFQNNGHCKFTKISTYDGLSQTGFVLQRGDIGPRLSFGENGEAAFTFAAYDQAFHTYSIMTEIISSQSSTVGLVVKGAASQTANLQEWKNSVGSTLSYIDKDGYGFIEKSTFILGLGKDLVTGINMTGIGSIASNYGKIIKWKAKAATNGVSGGFTFDINKNGVSIFSSPPSVAANTTTVQTGNTFSSILVAENDEFTIDIDSVGTGVQNVSIILYYLVRNN